MKKILSFFRDKNHRIFILIYILITIVYVSVSAYMVKGKFDRTDTAYYNYQIMMLKRGRLDLNSPITYDLSLYKNKWYMYWGPAPLLFIFPFYILGKINTSDVIYTLTAGLLNVLLYYLIVLEFVKYFKLRQSILKVILAVMAFAFVTPNFILSLRGTVWATNQSIAVFYMLLSLLLLGKYLNSNKFTLFIGSFIAFCLAAFSRYSMLLQGFIFLYPLYLLFKKNKLTELIKKVSIISFIFLTFSGIFFTYNFIRFNNPFEVGMRFQKGGARYDSQLKQNKIFSIRYFPHNFNIYFLHHLYPSLKKPYLNIDKEGNSMFSVYPTFLLLFLVPLFKKIKTNKYYLKEFYSIGIVTISLGIIVLLAGLGSGWVQFGLRYLADAVPVISLLLILIFMNYPMWTTIPVVLYGSAIQIYGSIVFWNMIK